MTEKTQYFDLDEYLSNNPKKTQRILSIFVNKHIPELVSEVITNLRKKDLTYEQIGTIFRCSRSTIFRIEKGQYWPKSKAKQTYLLKRTLELI